MNDSRVTQKKGSLIERMNSDPQGHESQDRSVGLKRAIDIIHQRTLVRFFIPDYSEASQI